MALTAVEIKEIQRGGGKERRERLLRVRRPPARPLKGDRADRRTAWVKGTDGIMQQKRAQAARKRENQGGRRGKGDRKPARVLTKRIRSKQSSWVKQSCKMAAMRLDKPEKSGGGSLSKWRRGINIDRRKEQGGAISHRGVVGKRRLQRKKKRCARLARGEKIK